MHTSLTVRLDPPALTALPVLPAGQSTMPPLSRAAVVDAAARCIARRADHRLRWSSIASDTGHAGAVHIEEWFEDLNALLDECYARTAQGLNDSLLHAETAPGTALDQVAAFVVAALEFRRARGVLLSFRRGADLVPALQRRLNEHDTAVRMRLKRLLNKGRRDGSLALRNLDSAVELLLATLQAPNVVIDGPEQRMWDGELVELLLAALAEPHPPEAEPIQDATVVQGSCLCGAVSYQLNGRFEALSHCRCSMCRKHHGMASSAFVSLPLAGFRWVSGESNISMFLSSDEGQRAFCRTCGSVTPIVDAEAGVVFCPAPRA